MKDFRIIHIRSVLARFYDLQNTNNYIPAFGRRKINWRTQISRTKRNKYDEFRFIRN
ncbi:hypothetical protein [Salinivirga cyanobacteriivorans]